MLMRFTESVYMPVYTPGVQSFLSTRKAGNVLLNCSLDVAQKGL